MSPDCGTTRFGQCPSCPAASKALDHDDEIRSRDGISRLLRTLHLIVLLALTAVWIAPPASGQMLAVPLELASPGQTAAWATRHGARLLGPGPLPGSYVIYGERSSLLVPALTNQKLLLAATPAACGEAPEQATVPGKR